MKSENQPHRKKKASPKTKTLGWKKIKDWIIFGIAVSGAILAILSFIASQKTTREARENTETVIQIQVQEHLDTAWDILGTEIGTSVLVLQPTNASMLELAKREIDKALALNPQSSRAYRILAVYFELSFQLEKAEEAYQKAIKFDPMSPYPYSNYGSFLLNEERLDEAEESIRTALELDSSLASAHNNLGKLLKQNNQLQEAEESYLKALEVASETPIIYNNYGVFLAEQGQLDEAEKMIRIAAKLDSNLAPVLANLASLLNKKNNAQEANRIYRKAMKSDPDLLSFERMNRKSKQRIRRNRHPYFLHRIFPNKYYILEPRDCPLLLPATFIQTKADSSKGDQQTIDQTGSLFYRQKNSQKFEK